MAARAVARETVVSLRREIARIEGRLAERLEAPQADAVSLPPRMAASLRLPMFPTGAAAFDAALGGGMPMAGLVELQGEATRDSALTTGFALALADRRSGKSGPGATECGASNRGADAPVLWIAAAGMLREAGFPYAPGLAARFALPPDRLLVATAPKPVDALWIAEEAANSGVFSAILVEFLGAPAALDLVATRRLHRRALVAGHPLFLIRQSGRQDGCAQPTAAPLRLRIRPAPSVERMTLSGPLTGSIGPPAFHVFIDKSRLAKPQDFTLEWTDHAFREQLAPLCEKPALSRSVAPLSAGGPSDASTLRTLLAFTRPGQSARPDLQRQREQHAARRGA